MANDITWLGYGALDLAAGDWVASNDVASFSFVAHPEQDNKFCIRELLRILGKRFATAEANSMWREIEAYQGELAATYGPPCGAIGGLSFEQAARDWYALYGRQFEKNWYLQTQLELHYARTARERVRGRWLRLIHPNLLCFVEAGFSAITVLQAILRLPDSLGGKFTKLFWQSDNRDLAEFWVRLAAGLTGFCLNEADLEVVLLEIVEHACRLNRTQGYPIDTAAVALNYFRRLELAGLVPKIS